MSDFPYQATEDYCIVDVQADGGQTPGGIFLPTQGGREHCGIIVSAGPGTWAGGVRTPNPRSEGEFVHFNGADQELRVGSKTYAVIRAGRCFAKRIG